MAKTKDCVFYETCEERAVREGRPECQGKCPLYINKNTVEPKKG